MPFLGTPFWKVKPGPLSEEHKKKISKALLGRKLPKSTKLKMSEVKRFKGVLGYQCKHPGCTRLGRHKGYYVNGDKKRASLCGQHQVIKAGKIPFAFKPKVHFPNKKCELCGWNKGPCDRHRINPPKGYVKGNVKILCPNCHRLVSQGLLEI